MAAHAKAAKTLDMFFKNGMKGSVQKDDVMLYAARNLMTNLAKPLVQQMGIGSAPVTMLDNASGTGVMTDQAQVLLREGNALDGSRFVAADSSQMLMDLVMRRVEEEGWVNTETKVLDAMDTKLPDDTFSHVAIGLALHLTPRPDDVLKDTIRILKPGGIVGFTTFQQGSVHRWWHGELRDAFPTFPFEAPFPDDMPMQLHSSGNWVDRKAVEEHLTANYSDELVDVEVKNVVGRYTFQQPEEWLLIFENMVGWLTSGWWSEETRQAHPADEVKELMLKHLTEKYQGKPWEVSWELICATARLRE